MPPTHLSLASKRPFRNFGGLLTACCLLAPLATPLLEADLAGYLARPDTSTTWKSVGEQDLGTAIFHEFQLTSQTWQGIPWEHNLYLFLPKGKSTARPGAAMLIIEGGNQKTIGKSASPSLLFYGAMLAEKLGVPCVLLKQVPNQPLYDGLKEDWLIARSFENYLDTGDATWPLLFPMTKAAIAAMDAIGAFSTEKLGTPLKEFIVMGASKRGWTTWLTAASDKRVTALAPIVIDVLNTEEQSHHQKKVLGEWSEQTAPYHPILRRKQDEMTRKLWSMVDPYSYRAAITQPKFILLGNNDPYWSTDSLNLYWDGLPSPKWVHYVPNAGHNLAPVGEKKKLPLNLIDYVAAFVRSHFSTDPAATRLPQLSWSSTRLDDGSLQLIAQSSSRPSRAHLWSASSANHDFRASQWQESKAAIEASPTQPEVHTITATLPPPAKGASAGYLTMEYDIDGLPCRLSTQLSIIDAPHPSGKQASSASR